VIIYSASQEGMKVNIEVNERVLKNIGTHWTIDFNEYQFPQPGRDLFCEVVMYEVCG